MLRKKVLRQMNRLLKIIVSHGQRYFMLLENHWEESDLTDNESHMRLERLQNILNQVPMAIEQAS